MGLGLPRLLALPVIDLQAGPGSGLSRAPEETLKGNTSLEIGFLFLRERKKLNKK